MSKSSIPFVEKYRPSCLDDVVLSPINRNIFKNIIKNDYFPNLLFYGPPGTGKTSTIVNLINEYQSNNKCSKGGNVIHLNASDERGIDVIRNHIFQFIKSNNFFNNSLKFVILDEVDYMTKNAQQALKYLLQSSSYNVRFCLICNYISKIDESLKNEFICVRFNQLPREDICRFIKNISEKENVEMSDKTIHMIIDTYSSDIRSMINFIQLNQNAQEWDSSILEDKTWETIHSMLSCPEEVLAKIQRIIDAIHTISIQYNIDKKNIMKKYFNYVIRTKKELVRPDFLEIVKHITHSTDSSIENVLYYFITALDRLFTEAL
jgi:replication factor C subunit 3/5